MDPSRSHMQKEPLQMSHSCSFVGSIHSKTSVAILDLRYKLLLETRREGFVSALSQTTLAT
jgi:hypothetical protein